MKLYLSPWTVPTRNRALEEYITTECHDDILLLYRNEPSVIVGRNQTVEAEADLEFCQQHGIQVLKRLSGGGTVYHDLGNVNFAFAVNKTTANPQSDTHPGGVLDRDFTAPIVAVLGELGIHATVGSRKELRVDGLKISGTASHVTRTRQLFHGTLLHQTDLRMLSRAIRGNSSLRGKGVASVPSEVINLAVLVHPQETTEDFLHRLGVLLLAFYGKTECDQFSEDDLSKIIALEYPGIEREV